MADRVSAIGFLENVALLSVESSKPPRQDTGANVTHQLVIKMQVVFAKKLPAQRLTRLGEVMEIGPRIAGAGRTRTCRIEPFLREFVNAAAHLEETARSENSAALRQLRRHDAIEHVHP